MVYWGNSDGLKFTAGRREYALNQPGELEGRGCMVLTLDWDGRKLQRQKNHPPVVGDNEIVVNGYFKGNAFIPGCDRQRAFPTDFEGKGEHWAVFGIASKDCNVVTRIKKPPKGKALVRGIIQKNEQDNTFKFKPDKNRSDHRHHAVDALTISFLDAGMLQKLSEWNSQGYSSYEGRRSRFESPWKNFRRDAEEAIKKILVSHLYRNPTITSGGAVRGQLHKEQYYGKHQVDGSTRFHIRKKLSDIQDSKQVEKIVDKNIREKIKYYLKEEEGIEWNEKDKKKKIVKGMFFKDNQPLIYLPNSRGGDCVPVRKVRIAEHFNLVSVNEKENRYVNPRNNHHIVIYKGREGRLQEKAVSFWEAARRKKSGKKVIQLPEDGIRMVASMEINEMFMLNTSPGEFEQKCTDPVYVSEHLYRVQKLSAGDYTFRLHTEATLERNTEPYFCRISSMKRWQEVDPFKVCISRTGEIRV